MSHGTGFSQPLGRSVSAGVRDVGAGLVSRSCSGWVPPGWGRLAAPDPACLSWVGTGLLANGHAHSEAVDVSTLLPLCVKIDGTGSRPTPETLLEHLRATRLYSQLAHSWTQALSHSCSLSR